MTTYMIAVGVMSLLAAVQFLQTLDKKIEEGGRMRQ